MDAKAGCEMTLWQLVFPNRFMNAGIEFFGDIGNG